MKKVYTIADNKGFHNVADQIISSLDFEPGFGTFEYEFLYTDSKNINKKIVVIIEGEMSFDEDHHIEYAAKLKLIANDKEIYNDYEAYYITEECKTNSIKNLMQNKIDEFTVYEIEDGKEINNTPDFHKFLK